MTGQDLLGKELHNARLRLLSPITEEGSLFGSPTPRGRSMILLTSQVPGTPYSLPSSARMPPISPNNHQPQQGRILPAVPVMYTSPELQSLVSQYLGQNTYGHYNLTQTQHGSRMYCQCCEPMNKINRSKKRKLRGEQEEPLVEEIPSGSRELVPLGQYSRTNTELINAARPGEFPNYWTEGYFPASIRRYDGWDERTAPGSASLTFGYSPRRFDHRYSSDDYDMSLGGESEVDRHIKEDLIQAASKYDSSMAKLQDTVDSFKGYRKTNRVSFE
ncbi:uncharacterized protein LOC141898440 [Tubulanus polymorphus]|uniref:uncharacterized protein LOC141898440 n=1 Tax=Tubulanus polymorphus TaxID=672921 RepID=UPI003DA5CA1E